MARGKKVLKTRAQAKVRKRIREVDFLVCAEEEEEKYDWEQDDHMADDKMQVERWYRRL